MCLYTGSVSTSSASFGQGGGPVHVSNIQCNGTETQLQACAYSLTNNCTHSSDAGIMCIGKPNNFIKGAIASCITIILTICVQIYASFVCSVS